MTFHRNACVLGVVALSACGARTGLQDDAPHDGTLGDSGVLDAAVDPCMRGGVPVPMSGPRRFPRGGLLSEAVLDGDSLRVLVQGSETPSGTQLLTQRLTLDGLVGDAQPLAAVPGDRPWDSSLVRSSTGEVVLATVVGDHIELRTEGSTAGPQGLSLRGVYVNLASNGARLAVSASSDDECVTAWADNAGRGLAAMHAATAQNSPYSLIDGIGRPPMRRPAGFTAAGEAMYYALTSDGVVRRLTASPERESVTDLSIASPGPRYYHSFVSALHAGTLAAMWIRTPGGRSGEDQDNVITLGVFDEGLRPRATPLTIAAPGQSYTFRMDMVWCSGRFLALWEDQSGVAVGQLDASGRLLGEIIHYGSAGYVAANRVFCMPGGAAVIRANEATTLRCQ